MKTQTTAKAAVKTSTAKGQTVAQFAKAHKLNAKVVRRHLRETVGKKPKTGWTITPAIAKQLAAH